MIPNLEWINNNFNYFNKKYFNGQLPVPRFSFNCPEDMWGCYNADAYFYGNRVTRIDSAGELALTRMYSRNEKSIQNTLLHEMIHMYIITVMRIMTPEEHGPDFFRIASFINRDGWNITDINEIGEDDVLNQGEDISDENGQEKLQYSIICVADYNTGTEKGVIGMKVSQNDVKNPNRIKNLIMGCTFVRFYYTPSPNYYNEKSDVESCYGFTANDINELSRKMANYYKDNKNFNFSTLKTANSNSMNESKKIIIISEEQENQLISLLKESENRIEKMPVDKKMNKPYCIDPEKVLVLKKRLDNEFVPLDYETMKGGKIECVKIAGRLTPKTKQVIEKLYEEDLVDWAADVCKKMFVDTDECEKFAKLVVNKWLNNKIGVHGMLDVNYF